MTPDPFAQRRAFITPIRRMDLMEPGQSFPAGELVRRILSSFWANCCGSPGLARAPAPVVELSGEPAPLGGVRPRLRAWWILFDGIIEDGEGPVSERLTLFYGRGGKAGQLWPRYEFRVVEKPFAVEMNFHQDPGLGWSTRIGLERLPDGNVRITGEEPLGE